MLSQECRHKVEGDSFHAEPPPIQQSSYQPQWVQLLPKIRPRETQTITSSGDRLPRVRVCACGTAIFKMTVGTVSHEPCGFASQKGSGSLHTYPPCHPLWFVLTSLRRLVKFRVFLVVPPSSIGREDQFFSIVFLQHPDW